MNKDKELEEAKIRLVRDITNPLACGDVCVVSISDVETVLQELDNSIHKKKIEDIKSKYERKYKKHKAVADKQFEEIGIRDCFENELAIRDLGAIRVCEELLEGK